MILGWGTGMSLTAPTQYLNDDTSYRCQPHRMGHRQHLDLNMDMDGGMDGKTQICPEFRPEYTKLLMVDNIVECIS